jgi:hypothetical protein
MLKDWSQVRDATRKVAEYLRGEAFEREVGSLRASP